MYVNARNLLSIVLYWAMNVYNFRNVFRQFVKRIIDIFPSFQIRKQHIYECIRRKNDTSCLQKHNHSLNATLSETGQLDPTSFQVFSSQRTLGFVNQKPNDLTDIESN